MINQFTPWWKALTTHLHNRINDIHSHIQSASQTPLDASLVDKDDEGDDCESDSSGEVDTAALLAESERNYHAYLEHQQSLNNHHDEAHYSSVPQHGLSEELQHRSSFLVDFAPVTHLEFIEALVRKPRDVVMSEFRLSQVRMEADGVRAEESIITGVISEVTLLHGNPMRIQRVFVRCVDSFEYGGVGWVLSSDVHHCMNCCQRFSGLVSAHHCYGCGNIVCGACSDSQGVVFELQNLGPQRVCTRCYWGQEMVYAQHGTASHSQSAPEDTNEHTESETHADERSKKNGDLERDEGTSSPLQTAPETSREIENVDEDPNSLENIMKELSGLSPKISVDITPIDVTPTSSDSTPSKSSSSTPTRRAPHPKPPRMHGWLKKQGHLVKNWKSRYFVLDNGYMTYYVDKLDAPPFGRDMKGQLCLAGYREREVLATPTAAAPPRWATAWSRVEPSEGDKTPPIISHEEDEDSEKRRMCRIHLGSNTAFGAQAN
eukprot:gene29110-36101_t